MGKNPNLLITGMVLLVILVSVLVFFIALVLYNAIGTNVADCKSLTDGNATAACESMKQYSTIVFTIGTYCHTLGCLWSYTPIDGIFSAP